MLKNEIVFCINKFFCEMLFLFSFFCKLLTQIGDFLNLMEEESNQDKPIIGASDIIDLPSLKLHNITCKIDTGADTSAIHTYQVRVTLKDTVPLLQFRVLDPSHPLYVRRVFNFKNFHKTLIRNSFGEGEERYVIKTKVQVFGKIYYTEFTLANRQEMRYPILLGKKFLENKFLVDVSLKNISYNLKKLTEQK